jgi:hypothetical protein
MNYVEQFKRWEESGFSKSETPSTESIYKCMADAEIGRATEMFMHEWEYIMGINRWIDSETEEEGTTCFEIDSIEELLAWSKENEK